MNTCRENSALPHYVDMVAIRKIASAEDGRLEKDVRSASSMDAGDRHKIL
jgi:hypothetical protein